MNLSALPLICRVISLDMHMKNRVGGHHLVSVYPAVMLRSMCASPFVAYEWPLLMMDINDKSISKHIPDFITHESETLVMSLVQSPELTRDDISKMRACLNPRRYETTGRLIKFGCTRLLGVKNTQINRRIYSHPRSIVMNNLYSFRSDSE